MSALKNIIAALLLSSGVSCTNHNYQNIIDTYQKLMDTQSGLIKDLERENKRLKQKQEKPKEQPKSLLRYPEAFIL